MTVTAARPAVPLPLVIIAGCIIAAIGFGTRGSFGLFTLPVTEDLGLSREQWGMAMAVQNLVWGIAQPFAGGMADKYGSGRVLAVGGLVYALGVLGMAFSPDTLTMTLTAGVVTGVGIAIASFGVVMAAFGRVVPAEKRSFVFGVATAASSAGQFIFAPLGQGFISAFGWQMALVWIALILLLVIPLSAALRGRTESVPGEADLPFMQALSRAWGYGSYRLLVIGFFVCGFHLAFINVHMPAYLVQCGLSPEVGSWTIAVIGLFNIVGSLLSGWLGSRLPKQMLLASIYLLRALLIAAFLLIPVSEITAYTFAAGMGLLWLSTVPLTAGLVTLFFGPRYMGMLYGIAFLSHQIGSFVGVWLGGVVYDQTGAYDLVWYLGILLGLGSAAIHIPINERNAANFGLKAA
ncbi:putative MFS family arabinose efflux permease [Devosia subaequoris]|uniref:Putative MFS family arabinose efflux permease n=1 Tax=Devosia subaequoris TaxID=395930 RepID=A0A7W6ILP3_9HYPH|nr:MFS transporter [Devosia subaequoris]MBB4051457.1 putative MFS family arabinose efflux permease [Devosia subaequoris]MCP1209050.1 MFS transporter [Devosia subaequoris]